MKQRIRLIACLALLLTVGCSTAGPEGGKTGKPGASKPRIALIMKSLANEFFSTMSEGAVNHQKQHADEYELIVNGIKDERDLARQTALVEEMIAQRVSAIVIAPADSKALAPVLKKALDQGIAVINIDNRLDSGVLKELKISIPFVGPDNRKGARKVAEYLAGRLKPNAKVAILEGITTAENAVQRKQGFTDGLGEKATVVSSQSAQWETAIANTITTALLNEHGDLAAILAANDSMALGALAAAKSAGRSELLIVGFDNISAVKQAIQDGQILATADQHGDQLAVYGIESALKMLKGEKLPEVVETPVDLITAEVMKAK